MRFQLEFLIERRIALYLLWQLNLISSHPLLPIPFSFPPTRNNRQEDKHTHTHTWRTKNKEMKLQKQQQQRVVVFISCFFFSLVQRFVILSLFVLFCPPLCQQSRQRRPRKKGCF